MAALAELHARLQDLHDQALGMRAAAEAEKRDLTPEEVKEIDAIFAEFDTVEGQIQRFTRLESNHRMLHTPGQRQTEASDPSDNPEGDTPAPPPIRANNMGRGKIITEVPKNTRLAAHERGNWGWRQGMGEFALAVARACSPGGIVDPRLDIRGAAPAEYMREGANADGGYAIPPDFRETIRVQLEGPTSLLARTDQITTAGNTVTVPVDTAPAWDSGSPAGVMGFWTAEAGQKLPSKPQLDQVQVSLNKLAVLIPVTDELLEDAPAIESFLRRKAADKITWLINYAILQGSGVGQPRGILHSSNTALVTVAPSSGQTINTVTYDNILDMWVRMPSEFRGNAVWVMNQAAEAQLLRMRFDTASTVPIPVYLPGGNNAAESPFSTLLGRPVMFSQAMPALGAAGDVLLVDFSQYLSVTKGGGIRTDVSIHLYFDYDITTFRFVIRIGGRPWWSYPVSPATGTQTLSPYVSLGSRAT